jgi:hypothetical protein
MTLFTLLLLYLSFRFKQLTCDFFLQSNWMALCKGNPGVEGYKALAAHAAVHAAGTTIIFLIFCPELWWFGAVDFLVHGLVDRLKAIITYDQKWTPSNWKFWWFFGLDQEAHNLTHLAYILLIIAYYGGVTT